MVYLQGGHVGLCQKCLPLKMHLYRETLSSKECNIIILNIYEKFQATDIFKLPFLCYAWCIIYSAMINLFIYLFLLINFGEDGYGRGHDRVLLPFEV